MRPGHSSIPRRADFRALFSIAIPAVLVNLGWSGMGVVDTLMVGHVSSADLAGVALGHLYVLGVTMVGFGTLLALDPIIAQAVGARDTPAVARGLQRGLVLACALSVVTALLLWPARQTFGLFRQPSDVIPLAAGYVRVSIPGVLPLLVFVVLRQSLQAMGRMRAIVLTVAAANLVNALLNWIFIYGHLGSPALGAVGAGVASSLSRWFMGGALLLFAWPVLGRLVRPLRREALDPRPLGRMVAIGIPIGIHHFLEFGAFATVALLMGYLGTVKMAGHQIALTAASTAFMVPLGISGGAAACVGQAVGRGDETGARRSAMASFLTGGGFMAGSAITFLVLPRQLAALFTEEPVVVAVAATLLPVAGVFQVFDGMQVVAAGILRGIGDTRVPMLVSLVGFWLVGMPVSLAFGFGLRWGATGLWWGFVAGLGAVAMALTWRVRRMLAGTLERIRVDEAEGMQPLPPTATAETE